jgi:hypothetical protein
MRFMPEFQSRFAMITILSALNLLAQGCGTGEEAGEAQLSSQFIDAANQDQTATQATPESMPKSTTGERLTLREASEHRIAGSYRRDGATLNFVAEEGQDTASLMLTDAAGQLLFESRRGVDASFEVLGRRYAIPGAGNGELTAELSAGSNALAALFSRADIGILPWLSRALGAEGITGRDYPASLTLHLFAQVVARATDTDVPPLPEEPLQSSAATLPADYETLQCQDLRGDPNKNECFGMCGFGCSCWTWVCGDCCSHPGCRYHDEQCRLCALNYPGACLLCWSPLIAFASGGGC